MFFASVLLIFVSLAEAQESKRIPIIYSTDLYQPPQDPDDHYDLAMLAALKELEVKALIFDVATPHKKPEEFGKTAMDQLAKITGHSPPPWKTGLRETLRSQDDKALEQPKEFQGGVELILSTLKQSEEPVVMFLVGSCRDFTAAFNRDPDLLRKKVKAMYVNAGNGPGGKQTEWNVTLDPNAYVGLMNSGLPIYWCPCFTGVYQLPSPEEVSADKAYSTFFVVPNQAELLASVHPKLKNYFAYALSGSQEEPLGFLEKEVQPLPQTPRSMWCTGPFLHAAGRKIYETRDNRWNARSSGKEDREVEVFRFEPIPIPSIVMKNEDGKSVPEFGDGNDGKPASIKVFR